MKNKKGFIVVWVVVALLGAELLSLFEASKISKEQEKNNPKDYINWAKPTNK